MCVYNGWEFSRCTVYSILSIHPMGVVGGVLSWVGLVVGLWGGGGIYCTPNCSFILYTVYTINNISSFKNLYLNLYRNIQTSVLYKCKQSGIYFFYRNFKKIIKVYALFYSIVKGTLPTLPCPSRFQCPCLPKYISQNRNKIW